MKQNNMNGETLAEVLKFQMQQCLERKNRTVRQLDEKIAALEERIWNTKKQLMRWEEHLRRLRIQREDAEIRCFKEIKRIHARIKKLTNSQEDQNSDNTANETD